MPLLRGSVNKGLSANGMHTSTALPRPGSEETSNSPPSERFPLLSHRPEAHLRCRFAIPAVVVPYALIAVRIEALPVVLHTSPELRVVDIDAHLYASASGVSDRVAHGLPHHQGRLLFGR
jgi:hypothetical protein